MSKKDRKKSLRVYYLTTALVILAVILVLDIFRFVKPEAEFSEMENRNLQTAPELTLNQVTSGNYAASYEDYVEDQFPFRTLWLQVKTLSDRLMGKVEANNIFLCDDGYLIQNFTEPEDFDHRVMIASLNKFASSHGNLTQYMMVIPTALNIYSDKLPPLAVVGDQDAYLDQLESDVVNAGIFYIDVRDTFRSMENTQLYYMTDHHWTTDGAYVAFQAFCAAVNIDAMKVNYDRLQVTDSFSGTLTASSGYRLSAEENIYVYLPKDSEVKFSVNYVEEAVTSASFFNTENLTIRDKYTVFMDGNHPLVKIETTADTDKVLLVLKDSYANCFIPFLVDHYDKILVVDPRYYYSDLEELLTSEKVTDVLYLYNANSFAEDTSLVTVIGEAKVEIPEEGKEEN